MRTRNRFIAEVPVVFRKQEISWLVLDEDAEETGGWYLYMHRDLDEGSEFDSWHLTRQEAEHEAETKWGVKTKDWKVDA